MLYRWCHDIGREQAANKPLLKTVFQVFFVPALCNQLFQIVKMNLSRVHGICTGHDAVI